MFMVFYGYVWNQEQKNNNNSKKKKPILQIVRESKLWLFPSLWAMYKIAYIFWASVFFF